MRLIPSWLMALLVALFLVTAPVSSTWAQPVPDETEETEEEEWEDDEEAFDVAVAPSSSSQVRPSESGPLSEWVDDSEESSSEEYPDTTPRARKQRSSVHEAGRSDF